MSDTILCPKCEHSMTFLACYSGCEAPVYGVNNYCCCNYTHYEYYKSMQAEVDRLRGALQLIDQLACYPADVQPDLPLGDYYALIERIHDIAYKAIKDGE